MIDIKTVTIVGAGNVASWFAFILAKNGFLINQIYSRSISNANELSAKYSAEPIDDIKKLSPNSDLYLFSLKDDVYLEVLDELSIPLTFAVHTSGSNSKEILSRYSKCFGVVYPCQTISKTFSFNELVVPLCVEGNNSDSGNILLHFAAKLSDNVKILDEQQRFSLHLAAVFASNFTNAMYDIAFTILEEKKIHWEMLLPLLQCTLDKTKTMSPQQAQTGPAKRGDALIFQRHIEQLPTKELQQIYQLLSDFIQKRNEK
jgi:predicted short-subunit dehydrogenase-like oxidoreductase (DUF2520 family)